MKYPRLNPGTKFSGVPSNVTKKTITDFWQWGYSNLISNMNRGILAEYLVAWAIGDTKDVRVPWRSYDLTSKSGKKLEVKTTAKFQEWNFKDKKPNPNPSYHIAPTRNYNVDSGYMSKNKKFNTDIYVLCYHFAEEIEDQNPMDLRQWKFWIFSKQQIKSILKTRKSISVAWLGKNYVSCEWGELKKNITKGKGMRKDSKEAIFGKTNGHCHFCGDKIDFDKYGKDFEDEPGNWEIDHMIQRGKGGKDDFANYLPACTPCNRLRWHRTGEDLREVIRLGLIAKEKIKDKSEIGVELKELLEKKEKENERRRS